jgi:hypothetical protein
MTPIDFEVTRSKVKVTGQRFFLAYFIAVIGSYSQFKIVYYFPNPQEKIPN